MYRKMKESCGNFETTLRQRDVWNYRFSGALFGSDWTDWADSWSGNNVRAGIHDIRRNSWSAKITISPVISRPAPTPPGRPEQSDSYGQNSIYAELYAVLPDQRVGKSLVMAALCNRGAIIFLPCSFFPSIYLLLLSFFSSPNLSGRRLDVYHTLTHGVALVRIYLTLLQISWIRRNK